MANMKIYGVPFSQPVRAVLWLLLMKRQTFELVMVNPGSSGENGSRHPDYLKMNPAGTIPCLLEPDTGFSVGESHAIMTYLADKYGWSDVYPEALQMRAKMNAYLQKLASIQSRTSSSNLHSSLRRWSSEVRLEEAR